MRADHSDPPRKSANDIAETNTRTYAHTEDSVYDHGVCRIRDHVWLSICATSYCGLRRLRSLAVRRARRDRLPPSASRRNEARYNRLLTLCYAELRPRVTGTSVLRTRRGKQFSESLAYGHTKHGYIVG